MGSVIKEHQFVISSTLLFLAAVIFAGALLISRSGTATTAQKHTTNPSITAGLPKAKDPQEIGGVIISNDQNVITLKDNGSDKTYTVTADAKTIVFKPGAKKDPATYEQEMTAFTDKLQYASASDGTYFAPHPYQEIPLTLSDIHTGDHVFIDADGASGSLYAVRILVGLIP